MSKFVFSLLSVLLGLLSSSCLSAQPVYDRHLAAGRTYSLFLDTEGQVHAWGAPGLPEDYAKPVPGVVLSGVKAVFADSHYIHPFVIRKDQSLWGWGGSEYGQVGLIQRVYRGTGYVAPRKLMNQAVYATASEIAFSLDPSGTLWVWGAGFPERGDGITETTTRPKKLLKDVAQVSSSSTHTLALKKDGTLWAWGSNRCGALGTGDTEFRDKPVQIDLSPLGNRKVSRIATRMTESFIVADDGTVWNWGEPNNMKPYCMDEPRWVPVRLETIDQVADIAVGYLHELYLKKDGSVWVTGYLQGAGSLTGGWEAPRKMMDAAAEIAAGEHHSLVLKKDGTVWAWGKNTFGQLGDGTTETRLHPVQVRFDLKPEELPPEPVKKGAPGTCAPLPTR